MQVHRGIPEQAETAAVLTIGNFDGVHLGHQALLSLLTDKARALGLPAVVLTFEPAVHSSYWMVTDYLPEVDALAGSRPLDAEAIAAHLGGRVEVVPVPADCEDGFFTAFWRRPEAYLDPVVRAGISACSQLPDAVVEPAVAQLAADLEDGTWAARHADLLGQDTFDGGYRLVVSG